MGDLGGKVALVTGGSRGIGAAIAKRLAADGASVALTYSASKDRAGEVVRDIEATGGTAVAIRADSGVVADIRRAVAETVAAFGALDILVNNAGVATLSLIDEFPLEEFERIVAVNYRGPFVAIQAAVPHMKRGGRIINIGSISSDVMPFEGGAVYASTKGALATMTRCAARDLGPRGITVNNVQSGAIDTDMNPEEAEFADAVRKTIALERYGRPEEVAHLVAFIAGPNSSYITGASLKIDGASSA